MIKTENLLDSERVSLCLSVSLGWHSHKILTTISCSALACCHIRNQTHPLLLLLSNIIEGILHCMLGYCTLLGIGNCILVCIDMGFLFSNSRIILALLLHFLSLFLCFLLFSLLILVLYLLLGCIFLLFCHLIICNLHFDNLFLEKE